MGLTKKIKVGLTLYIYNIIPDKRHTTTRVRENYKCNISAREKLAVCDIKNLQYMDIK